MLFDQRADRLQQSGLSIRNKNNKMRIPDRYRDPAHGLTSDGYLFFLSDSDLSHIHRYAFDFSAADLQIKRFNAGERFDQQMRFVGISLVVYEFSHAADPVAAHFRFAAVGVEDTHFEIRLIRGRNIDHPVGSGAEMAIRQLLRNGGDILRDVTVYV